eukprot:364937-Chlamydomonas_euryale.AAC.4
MRTDMFPPWVQLTVFPHAPTEDCNLRGNTLWVRWRACLDSLGLLASSPPSAGGGDSWKVYGWQQQGVKNLMPWPVGGFFGKDQIGRKCSENPGNLRNCVGLFLQPGSVGMRRTAASSRKPIRSINTSGGL